MSDVDNVGTDVLLSEASDVIEQTLDILENRVESIVTVTKNNPLIVVGGFLLGAGVGGFVAYKLAVKRTTLRYEDIMAEEIEAAKKFYKRLNKEGIFDTPEGAVEALVPENVVSAISTYQGKDKATRYDKVELDAIAEVLANDPDNVEVEVETVLVTTNVFTDSKNDPRDWDYTHELSIRDTTKPYVIAFEEFEANDEGNEQSTLTYYSGDRTLADEKESPIDDEDRIVGEDNMLRFGHGSLDDQVVYIRNERLGMDFEVIRSGGKFSEEVMGFEPETEIRHSSDRRIPRKFRGTDE